MPDNSGGMSRPNRGASQASTKFSESQEGPEFKRPLDPKRVLQILECKRKVLRFVESMLEPDVTLDELKAGEELICRLDYDSITQERHILKICGYPPCSNKLTKVWKQKFHVSLKDKKIYDVEVRKLYCSVRCMETSLRYRVDHVPEQPVWMRLEDLKMGPNEINSSECNNSTQ